MSSDVTLPASGPLWRSSSLGGLGRSGGWRDKLGTGGAKQGEWEGGLARGRWAAASAMSTTMLLPMRPQPEMRLLDGATFGGWSKPVGRGAATRLEAESLEPAISSGRSLLLRAIARSASSISASAAGPGTPRREREQQQHQRPSSGFSGAQQGGSSSSSAGYAADAAARQHSPANSPTTAHRNLRCSSPNKRENLRFSSPNKREAEEGERDSIAVSTRRFLQAAGHIARYIAEAKRADLSFFSPAESAHPSGLDLFGDPQRGAAEPSQVQGLAGNNNNDDSLLDSSAIAEGGATPSHHYVRRESAEAEWTRQGAEAAPAAAARLAEDWLLSALSASELESFEQPWFLEDCRQKFQLLDLRHVGFLTAEDLRFPTLQLELMENGPPAFDPEKSGRISLDAFPDLVKFCQVLLIFVHVLSKRGRESRPPALPRADRPPSGGGLSALRSSWVRESASSRQSSASQQTSVSRQSSASPCPVFADFLDRSSESLLDRSADAILERSAEAAAQAQQGEATFSAATGPSCSTRQQTLHARITPGLQYQVRDGGAAAQSSPAGRRRQKELEAGATSGVSQKELEAAAVACDEGKPGRKAGGNASQSRGGSGSRAGSTAASWPLALAPLQPRPLALAPGVVHDLVPPWFKRRLPGPLVKFQTLLGAIGEKFRAWHAKDGQSREEYEALQREALKALLQERQKQEQQLQNQKLPLAPPRGQAKEETSAAEILGAEVFCLVQGVVGRENVVLFTLLQCWLILPQLLRILLKPILKSLAHTSGMSLGDILGQLLWKQRRSEPLQSGALKATVENPAWVDLESNGANVGLTEEVFRALTAADGGRMSRVQWLGVVRMVQRNPLLRQRVRHGDADRLFHSITSRSKEKDEDRRTVSLDQFMTLLLMLVETTATHPWMIFLAVGCHAEHLTAEALIISEA
ncbi:unnamed protein product [Polarella glacialis]|uniref:Uncharacterized protein n=1 Tax=Polarella glacialis TaxID=89957 RepID=A0A813L246_POLGL|nr:unnamed protein product [Polarella glacialis]